MPIPPESDPPGPCLGALQTTLDSLEFDFEAAAIVALCRATAELLDRVTDAGTFVKLANTYIAELKELRGWIAQPEIPALDGSESEDPFDALAKALSKGSKK